MRHVGWLALPLLIAGCGAQEAAPVTIQQALSGVERDLISGHTLVVSATMLHDAVASATFDRDVLAYQCSQGVSDPEVALLQQNVELDLSGSFNEGAQFQINGPGAAPLAGVSASVDRSKSQQVNLPITFVTLSDMPDVVLQRRMETLKQLSQPLQARLQPSAEVMRDELDARVHTLIGGFTAAACTKEQQAGTGGLIMDEKRPVLPN